MSRPLALFDVDGTLTTRDTLLLFLRHAVGDGAVALAALRSLPWLAGYAVGLVSNARAKEVLLRNALGSLDRATLSERARAFADTVDGLLRPGALDTIARHRAEGEVLLVSASLDLWLAPWAERHGLRLLCTGARWEGDRFAGLATPNCHGEEKVNRVRAAVDLGAHGPITGYGDSSGDTAMLALCATSHWRPFR